MRFYSLLLALLIIFSQNVLAEKKPNVKDVFIQEVYCFSQPQGYCMVSTDGPYINGKPVGWIFYKIFPHNSNSLVPILKEAKKSRLKVRLQYVNLSGEENDNFFQIIYGEDVGKRVLKYNKYGMALVNAQILDQGSPWKTEVHPLANRNTNLYKPTVVSPQKARELFDILTNSKLHMDKLCFNRAHAWARLLDVMGFKTQKVLLGYTNNFLMSQIRKASEKRYKMTKEDKWYFHTAPYVLVDVGGGQIEEWVLDPEFFAKKELGGIEDKWQPGPQKLKDWYNYFVDVKEDKSVVCAPMEQTYKWHGLYFPDSSTINGEPTYCYIRTGLPMYFYDDLDVFAMDRENKVRSSWDTAQLKEAISVSPSEWQERLRSGY